MGKPSLTIILLQKLSLSYTTPACLQVLILFRNRWIFYLPRPFTLHVLYVCRVVNDRNFGWRGLRLMAQQSSQFFTHNNNNFIETLPEYLESMIQKEAKHRPMVSLVTKPRVDGMGFQFQDMLETLNPWEYAGWERMKQIRSQRFQKLWIFRLGFFSWESALERKA